MTLPYQTQVKRSDLRGMAKSIKLHNAIYIEIDTQS